VRPISRPNSLQLARRSQLGGVIFGRQRAGRMRFVCRFVCRYCSDWHKTSCSRSSRILQISSVSERRSQSHRSLGIWLYNSTCPHSSHTATETGVEYLGPFGSDKRAKSNSRMPFTLLECSHFC
jgi:hypothetical protein